MPTKEEVISELCELTSIVGRKVYHSEHAHDCFCGENKITIGSFHFDRKVLDYIKDAVNEKMEKK